MKTILKLSVLYFVLPASICGILIAIMIMLWAKPLNPAKCHEEWLNKMPIYPDAELISERNPPANSLTGDADFTYHTDHSMEQVRLFYSTSKTEDGDLICWRETDCHGEIGHRFYHALYDIQFLEQDNGTVIKIHYYWNCGVD